MNNRYLILMIAALALAALACNAGGSADDSGSNEAVSGVPAQEQPADASQPAGPDQPAGEQPAGEAPPGEAPVSQGQQAAQPSSLPVGMRQGLASLNSYRLIMNNANIGPTPQDISTTSMEVRYSAENDARYMRNETLETSSEYPDPYSSLEETYQIGLQSCSVSTYDGTTEVTPSELTALVRDMTLATTNLFDINITVENPSLIGPETINGVPSNHYTYQITGLGDYSGEEVTQASGEYWVAQDGQYLVKYALVLEVRNAPEGDANAEVVRSEITFDLQDVNQPQSITMPPDC